MALVSLAAGTLAFWLTPLVVGLVAPAGAGGRCLLGAALRAGGRAGLGAAAALRGQPRQPLATPLVRRLALPPPAAGRAARGAGPRHRVTVRMAPGRPRAGAAVSRATVSTWWVCGNRSRACTAVDPRSRPRRSRAGRAPGWPGRRRRRPAALDPELPQRRADSPGPLARRVEERPREPAPARLPLPGQRQRQLERVAGVEAGPAPRQVGAGQLQRRPLHLDGRHRGGAGGQRPGEVARTAEELQHPLAVGLEQLERRPRPAARWRPGWPAGRRPGGRWPGRRPAAPAPARGAAPGSRPASAAPPRRRGPRRPGPAPRASSASARLRCSLPGGAASSRWAAPRPSWSDHSSATWRGESCAATRAGPSARRSPSSPSVSRRQSATGTGRWERRWKKTSRPARRSRWKRARER